MSYVLDGIRTAYVVGDVPMGDNANHGVIWRCPCGFAFSSNINRPLGWEATHVFPALRFHYDHCVQARIPDIDRELGE